MNIPTGTMAQNILKPHSLHVIIDVSNLLGAMPQLRWWRNRVQATNTVYERVVKWNQSTGEVHKVSFMIEGAVQRSFQNNLQTNGVTVVHSNFVGRDACDNAIVNLVGTFDKPARASSVVVTSDKALRERLLILSCPVIGVRAFLETVEQQRAL